MLTILEVGNVDDDRIRGLRACLEPAGGREGLRWVVVQPGPATWTEAHGHELLVEHVQAPSRVAGAQWLGRVGGGVLRDLVQLHRPAAIVCGWPWATPGPIALASARLVPRPALIGVAHGDLAALVHHELAHVGVRAADLAARASGWWAVQALGSFDAVFIDTLRAARRLWAHGLDRIYRVPRGLDLEEFSPKRSGVEALVADRPRLVVAAAIGPEVDAPVLRRIHAALSRALGSEPNLVIVDRGIQEPRARLARFAAGFAHVHLPDCSAAGERARWLATCDVALILPGQDAGSLCMEALACGLPSVAVVDPDTGALVVDRAATFVEESGCGRVLVQAEPERIAEAIVQLGRSELRASLGQRARSFAERLRLADCLAREQLCVREVVEHVRAGERVPSGIHERMQPSALTS